MDDIDRAGETPKKAEVTEAVAMLHAFESVGAQNFDVTLTDIEGQKVPGEFKPNRSLGELRRSIGARLEAATRLQTNFIIRPRSTTALLIQLDDFDDEKAARMEPYSFMTLRTSPNNYQVWLAVSDAPKEGEKEAAKEFRTRVRRGAGADQSATGATRIAGSINFKPKYAPAFPRVEIERTNAGRTVTVATLEKAGLVAPAEPLPPASVPPSNARPGPKVTAPRHWPDYQQVLSGAPRKKDGTPDRSRADYMFCKWSVQRGHSIEATAAKLAEVSEKAQQEARNGDTGYARLTAWNAAKAVEKDRSPHQSVKSTAHPG